MHVRSCVCMGVGVCVTACAVCLCVCLSVVYVSACACACAGVCLSVQCAHVCVACGQASNKVVEIVESDKDGNAKTGIFNGLKM